MLVQAEVADLSSGSHLLRHSPRCRSVYLVKALDVHEAHFPRNFLIPAKVPFSWKCLLQSTFRWKFGGDQNDFPSKVFSHGNRRRNSFIANTLLTKVLRLVCPFLFFSFLSFPRASRKLLRAAVSHVHCILRTVQQQLPGYISRKYETFLFSEKSI